MNPLLLLLFPLAEIAGFILVGRAIGVVSTLALVVASAIVGLALLRDAGLMTVQRLQRGFEAPATILAEGGARMAAGLLLLIPGFLTDIAAAALLVPSLRRALARRFAPEAAGPAAARREAAPGVIEGEFRRIDR